MRKENRRDTEKEEAKERVHRWVDVPGEERLKVSGSSVVQISF